MSIILAHQDDGRLLCYQSELSSIRPYAFSDYAELNRFLQETDPQEYQAFVLPLHMGKPFRGVSLAERVRSNGAQAPIYMLINPREENGTRRDALLARDLASRRSSLAYSPNVIEELRTLEADLILDTSDGPRKLAQKLEALF